MLRTKLLRCRRPKLLWGNRLRHGGPEQVTRCSRGDWTPLELFLASVRRWETGLWRIFVWETEGKRP